MWTGVKEQLFVALVKDRKADFLPGTAAWSFALGRHVASMLSTMTEGDLQPRSRVRSVNGK